jgi:hypothetical protein
MWIDAICINQRNPREQEHQIGLMRDIFGGCAQCIVWLGEEDHETEKVLESLHWMQDNLHVHEWPCLSSPKLPRASAAQAKTTLMELVQHSSHYESFCADPGSLVLGLSKSSYYQESMRYVVAISKSLSAF